VQSVHVADVVFQRLQKPNCCALDDRHWIFFIELQQMLLSSLFLGKETCVRLEVPRAGVVGVWKELSVESTAGERPTQAYA
jgi:hypothetical protein